MKKLKYVLILSVIIGGLCVTNLLSAKEDCTCSGGENASECSCSSTIGPISSSCSVTCRSGSYACCYTYTQCRCIKDKPQLVTE